MFSCREQNALYFDKKIKIFKFANLTFFIFFREPYRIYDSSLRALFFAKEIKLKYQIVEN